MLEQTYAVILAGGKGERFWPLSTSDNPKQFLRLFGDRSLLGIAVDRLQGIVPPERILVITRADLVDATRKTAPELPVENILGEPVGRDTAAAVALAAALVKNRDPNGVFCILTADHIIGDISVFRQTLHATFQRASSEDVLITIGIKPHEASSAYGYIESGEALDKKDGTSFFGVRRFVEKPDEETAQSYVQSGNYYWNSGMFIWTVATLEKAFATHCPFLAEFMAHIIALLEKNELEKNLASIYTGLKKISIDYALMEFADNIIMAEGTFAWDDVGSWPAIASHFKADPCENICIGDTQMLDANNNIVVSDGHLTALLGVKDLVVIQTQGATLICAKERAQDIKKMVALLRDTRKYDSLL